MLQLVYTAVRNALLFYFLTTVFNGIKVGTGTLWSTILVSVAFGALMMTIPTILKFFKLPVSVFASILLGLVLTFVFLFLFYLGFADVGSIGSTYSPLGIGGTVLILAPMETLLVATIVIATSVVGMDWLSEQ